MRKLFFVQQVLLHIHLDLLETLHKQRIPLDGILISASGSVLDVLFLSTMTVFYYFQILIETTPVGNTTIIWSELSNTRNQFNLKNLALDNVSFEINNHELLYCIWTFAIALSK